MDISFKFMQHEDIDLWNKWTEIEHVKDTWFLEGYETPDYINQKIEGNGYDYPYIILVEDKPVGFIQCCDLFAYKSKCENLKGIFLDEEPGTFCLDLFIGEEEYLNKGYGSLTVEKFIAKLFKDYNANSILVDPSFSNKRAIRCYEKAGFEFVRVANDGVCDCYVMKLDKNDDEQDSIF